MATRSPHLNPIERNCQQVLDLTVRLLGFTDKAVSEQLPPSDKVRGRHFVLHSRRGGRVIKQQDVHDLAIALDVPEELFRMEPLEAGHWLLVNRSDQVIRASTWIDATLVGAGV